MNEVVFDSDTNYFCDRCGKITKSMFPELGHSARTQIKAGLHIEVIGYYGGFYDTYLDDGPDVIHFCHDCSLWFAREVGAISERSKGGHPCDSESERCCEYAWSPEEETMEILSDPEWMKSLAEAQEDVDSGNLVDFKDIETSTMNREV